MVEKNKKKIIEKKRKRKENEREREKKGSTVLGGFQRWNQINSIMFASHCHPLQAIENYQQE